MAQSAYEQLQDYHDMGMVVVPIKLHVLVDLLDAACGIWQCREQSAVGFPVAYRKRY